MSTDMEQLYQERLNRYVTALNNEKPDKIPIRPFVAEFTAKYANFTSQDVAHDYNKAFVAARKCAADFDWDAIVPNMVYVWTGLAQALGLKYYAIPGIHIPPDTGFQYREPGEDDAFMKEDEYDELIDDPTGFLYNTWLPRVSEEISPMGEPTSYRNNLALAKGGMAMLQYFTAFGPQIGLMRSESGTASAIAGIFKAPFDIIGDKLRGYMGLTMDMMTQPDKVLKACEALMPHLYNVALTSADPSCKVPIGYWMHRGCIPFVSAGQFESHYWSTVKPVIEELWKNGHQTMFYAEGDWKHHLESFTELPDRSILYHVDRGDIFEVHRKLGHKFCLSGGMLVNAGIHMVDVGLWMTGEKTPVSAVGGGAVVRENPHGDTNDVYSITYEFEDGTLMNHRGDHLKNRTGFATECVALCQHGHLQTSYDVLVRMLGQSAGYRGGEVKGLYARGTQSNIDTFHKNIIGGVYENPTLAPSVNATLTTILGREVAFRKERITMAQLLKENRALPVDFSGMKA